MTSRRIPLRLSTVPARALALGCALVVAASLPALAQDYLGSEFCSRCHMDKYNEWKVSGHPYKLTEAASAFQRPIPLPEGYTWDDISYVIGGYRWKSRYMGLDGYIITSVQTDDGEVLGQNQYNNWTGEWVDYHPGELKPYNCGRCHTTGFSPEGNQDGLPGIEGTWAFGGIQCEACHGPGMGGHGQDDHIDRSSAACGACHIRGDENTIPAKGGFIRHHEQYNELLASPHQDMACVTCHNPHKRTEFSIVRTCEDCHTRIADGYAGSEMDVFGVGCVDCHMAYASKSAVAVGPYQGDIRTHLFTLNTSRDQTMFTEDGGFVLLNDAGQGAVTLDFACLSCHTDQDLYWAVEEAQDFHDYGYGDDDDDDDDFHMPLRRVSNLPVGDDDHADIEY